MHSPKRILYIFIGLFGLICIIAIWTFCYARIHTVRLLDTEVVQMLENTIPSCTKMTDCILQPGDILIRRYVTKDSLFTQTALGLYFTHAGFYLGDDQMVEAHGREKNPIDGIRTSYFSTSMWTKDSVQNWVVIRPKKYNGVLDIIKSNLVRIANDPEYVFGIPKDGFKRALCADLIFNQLALYRMVDEKERSKFITPDYLLLVAVNNPEDFQIVGYGIEK